MSSSTASIMSWFSPVHRATSFLTWSRWRLRGPRSAPPITPRRGFLLGAMHRATSLILAVPGLVALDGRAVLPLGPGEVCSARAAAVHPIRRC
jgi:hypothetical protein